MPLSHEAQRRGRRRAVLGIAVCAALVIALLLPDRAARHAPVDAPLVGFAQAADAPPAKSETPQPAAPSAAASGETKPDAVAPKSSATAASPDASSNAEGKQAASPDKKGAAEIRIDPHGVFIDRGGSRVRVQGLGADREYDSFDQFVEDSPWLAALVFGIVFGIFLVPLLIIILVIWYKMRKTRMQNETILRLAERGVTPEAIGALTGGVARPATDGGTATPAAGSNALPRYMATIKLGSEQRASDLRRGVILTAVGLAFLFYSMINEGSASWVGLVLLFLGVGYCILWIFEDRKAQTPGAGPPPASGT